MADRNYDSASATGRNTTTTPVGTAWQTQVSLSIPTPGANKVYLIGAYCLLDNNSSSSDSLARLRHTTASVTLQETNLEAQDTTDVFGCFFLGIYEAGASDPSQTFAIQYGSESTNSTGCQSAYIWWLELEASDLYTFNLAEESDAAGSGTHVINSLSVPAGDWVILAALTGDSTALTDVRWDVTNTTDAVTYASMTGMYSQEGTNWVPWSVVYDIGTLAGTKTIALRHTAPSMTSPVISRQRVLVALDKGAFANAYSAQNPSRATITGAGSNSPNTRTTLTETTAESDHLLLCSWWNDYFSVSSSALSDITEDAGALVATISREPNTGVDVMPAGFSAVRPLTAASHTFLIRYWNESTSVTGGITQANIVLLQLEQSAANYNVGATLAAEASIAATVTIQFARSATLAIEADISAAGSAGYSGAATLAAEADIAGGGVRGTAGAAILAVDANIAGDGQRDVPAAGTLAAEADIAGASKFDGLVAGSLGAEADIAGAGSAGYSGAAVLAAEADIAGLSSLTFPSSGSLAIEADIAGAGQRDVPAGASLAADLDIDGAVQANIVTGATLATEADMTGVGVRGVHAAASLAADLDLAGSAGLDALVAGALPAEVAAAGSAALAATDAGSLATKAGLTGAGTIQIAVSAALGITVTLTGDAVQFTPSDFGWREVAALVEARLTALWPHSDVPLVFENRAYMMPDAPGSRVVVQLVQDSEAPAEFISAGRNSWRARGRLFLFVQVPRGQGTAAALDLAEDALAILRGKRLDGVTYESGSALPMGLAADDGNYWTLPLEVPLHFDQRGRPP